MWIDPFTNGSLIESTLIPNDAHTDHNPLVVVCLTAAYRYYYYYCLPYLGIDLFNLPHKTSTCLVKKLSACSRVPRIGHQMALK